MLFINIFQEKFIIIARKRNQFTLIAMIIILYWIDFYEFNYNPCDKEDFINLIKTVLTW